MASGKQPFPVIGHLDSGDVNHPGRKSAVSIKDQSMTSGPVVEVTTHGDVHKDSLTVDLKCMEIEPT